MLILTEKPSVAKDFANALGCSYNSSEQIYKSPDGNVVITNCVGHLFNLQQPEFYNPEFKHWINLPVIPEEFSYSENPQTKDVAKRVITQLKKHSKDSILIATDADREGEVIARECLNAAGIFDYTKIKRFWVSQALTPKVIHSGIKNAKPLVTYNLLSDKGFCRQKADWLVGINFTRYLSNCSGLLLPVGRVQTAVLAAIASRCSKIENFHSEKYFEFEGEFGIPHDTLTAVTATYIDDSNNSAFPSESKYAELKAYLYQKAVVISDTNETKQLNPPQLYNLNELQKDAFKYYGYSAEKTLQMVQKLYEEYKCVSYPRTPSRVLGEANIGLCEVVFNHLSQKYKEYSGIKAAAAFSLKNKRIFDDSKLESHHAIIPLAELPQNAAEDESNVYHLILERFFVAFAPVHKYDKRTVILKTGLKKYKVEGKSVIEEGWKKYELIRPQLSIPVEEKTEQNLSAVDWNNLYLTGVNTLEKYTKAPKYFNEASILAFMENPKAIETEEKLVGLGTPATRHTFIPKLQKAGYITVEKKNIVITELGKTFLQAIDVTSVSSIAQISQTTRWEEQLESNPEEFLTNTKRFVADSVTEKVNLTGKFSHFSTKKTRKTVNKRGKQK